MTTQWSTQLAIWAGTPEEAWRTIMASMPMASTVSTVSRNDSPFFKEDEPAAKERTSADIRLAAVSNDIRVRVESSKNRVATVRPRRVGTFGLARRPTSAKESATRQHLGDVVGGQVVDAEQVGGERAHRTTRSPRATPSSDTSTISSRRVGRFFPT